MSSRLTTINIPKSFASTVVDCIFTATGDGIKEDIALHRLRTRNSVPARIWDLINTAICERLNTPDCMTITPRRGAWEIVIIYERETEFIYTIMRGKRFRELRDGICKRNKMHYVDLLVRHLNPDLLAPVGQTTLFPVCFDDENKLAENVQKILAGFSTEIGEIKRHAIILFESANFNLTSVQAIVVDSNLNIVSEQSLTEYIPVQESNISEKVENPNNPSNNPSRGLKLTEKAAARKQLALKKREREITS